MQIAGPTCIHTGCVKFQHAEKYLFKGSISNMENTLSLDIARMATFKLLAVKSYLARIAQSFIEQVCFRRSQEFTLLINAQSRSKSFSCMYFLYLLLLIRRKSMVMHLISSFSTSILS